MLIFFPCVQPAFFVAVFTSKENIDVQPSNAGGEKLPTTQNSSGPVEPTSSNLVDTLLSYVADYENLINKYVLLETSVDWVPRQFLFVKIYSTTEFCDKFVMYGFSTHI